MAVSHGHQEDRRGKGENGYQDDDDDDGHQEDGSGKGEDRMLQLAMSFPDNQTEDIWKQNALRGTDCVRSLFSS